MKRTIAGLFVAGGVAVSVVVVLKDFLSRPKRPAQSGVPKSAAKSAPHFTIKRTKSEVGHAYWVLQGFGPYKCYVLCDTWDEAMTRARHLQEQVDAHLAVSNS